VIRPAGRSSAASELPSPPKLLRVRLVLRKFFGNRPSKEPLARLVATGEGRDALARILRKAKADRVGTAIADLTICGAIPPYNEVLGGKLLAMLMMSPEVVAEYRRPYAGVPSVIASSMAGRPIVRPADLAFIGTTSLYGHKPCQYDRVTFPDTGTSGARWSGRETAPQQGTAPQQRVVLRYEYLGRTQGLGTFHFGEQTVKDMGLLLLAQSRNTLSPVGERG